MNRYRTMTILDIQTLYREELKRYEAFKKAKLKLDLTRGKPSDEQLRMVTALGLDHALSEADYRAADGSDIRNYGSLFGLREAREFFADLMGLEADQVMVFNQSSLTLMYDFFARAFLFPLPGATQAWSQLKKLKVLCPSPGYDRHFAIAEAFGMELIPITMTDEGPDMDEVENWVEDPSVKAMFSVPMYSNPTGVVYSEEVCHRLAKMQAAPDFRIIWDHAYFLHHLDWDHPAQLPNVFDLAREYGHENRFVQFSSTSKITYAGSGLAVIATSKMDFSYVERNLKLQSIGPDKLNQMRHLRFFEAIGGIEELMRRHASILKPKFERCFTILEEELDGLNLAEWTEAKGGYFISIDLRDGQAKRVVDLAAAAGVRLTAAGSTYPYGRDPRDRNIRLAPSYPTINDLDEALRVLCTCIKFAAFESYLGVN